MKDVAAAAGVSLKTVTNVVHGRTVVKEETRQRVQAAIDKLSYRPSIAGRQLRSGRSQIIILALPRIDEPYFAALAHAVIEAAESVRYTVMIEETSGLLRREVRLISGNHGQFIDGVILSPLAIDTAQLLELNHGSPLVLLGEHIQSSGLDLVTIDNLASAGELVRHLIAGGRQHIAFVGQQSQGPRCTGDLRLGGYRRALVEAGLEIDGELIIDVPHFTRDSGAAATSRLLPILDRVDAVVCGSDLLALGLMRGLREAGVGVPDQIAVVGWDNIAEGMYHSPSLTTIAPDLQLIARRSVAALLRLIEGDATPEGTVIVPHQLMINDSSTARICFSPA